MIIPIVVLMAVMSYYYIVIITTTTIFTNSISTIPVNINNTTNPKTTYIVLAKLSRCNAMTRL